MSMSVTEMNKPKQMAIFATLSALGACERAASEPLEAYAALTSVRRSKSSDFGLLAALKKRSALMML